MHPTVSATLAETVEAPIDHDGVSSIRAYSALLSLIEIAVEKARKPLAAVGPLGPVQVRRVGQAGAHRSLGDSAAF
jgi:hypothetical protein